MPAPAGNEGEIVFAGQTLAETIRLLRTRTKLTIEQLAIEADLSPTSLRSYEVGRVVPDWFVGRRIIRALADHLKHDVNALWRDVGRIAERYTGFDEPSALSIPIPLPTARMLITAASYRLNVEPEDAWRVMGELLDSIWMQADGKDGKNRQADT